MNSELAGRVASILPPRDGLGEDDRVRLADSLIGVGMRIAGILHDEDPAEAAELVAGLSPDRAWALPFVLAAMVDVDKSARELFDWAPFITPKSLMGATGKAPASILLRSRPRPGRVVECGCERAWQWHKDHDQEPCDACWTAHRAYEADKKAARRFRQAAECDPQVRARVDSCRAALAAVHVLKESQLELFAAAPQPRRPEEANHAA